MTTEETKQQIIIEAAKEKAKSECITQYGVSKIGTPELRSKLNQRDKLTIIRFLYPRTKHWVDVLTPKITAVYCDGKKLEEYQEDFMYEFVYSATGGGQNGTI